MKLRMVAFDLDGTLLDSQKQVSAENLRALERCCKEGIYVVPCTGRTVSGIPEAVRNIKGLRYVIAGNGSRILDLETGELIGHCLMDQKLVLDVLQQVSGNHIYYDMYVGDRCVGEKRLFHRMDEYCISPEIQKLFQNIYVPVENLTEYIRQYGSEIDKINLFFDDLQEREEVRSYLEEHFEVLVTDSLENNLEINAAHASKGNALMKLAEFLGINKEEIMACGDGSNDIPMIRKAGIGIAMENARPDVIAAADHVTRSHDASGVAHAINTYVFGETDR